MIADLEKNFDYFVNEIVPFIEVLRECRFTFDYEKSKMTIHCKNREHKLAVNGNLFFYFLYLPGEYFQIASEDTLHPFLILLGTMIELDNENFFNNDDDKKNGGYYFRF